MPSASEIEYHSKQAEIAADLYKTSSTPSEDASDWHDAVESARTTVRATLKATNNLRQINTSLASDGSHALVLRHLMAPPISQDQFRQRCAEYRKSAEKKKSPLPAVVADAVVAEFLTRHDTHLMPWISENRDPTTDELRRLSWAVAPLIANQELSTIKRNRAAAKQEKEVCSLLDTLQWRRLPAQRISERGQLPTKTYMHKTRVATQTTPQEVDIACGLRGTYVLAMECKVSNDETNSIKRVNDVLKKASAWKSHWGSFFVTAALLQGVFAKKEVVRLLQHEVLVFWSHDLGKLQEWLVQRSR